MAGDWVQRKAINHDTGIVLAVMALAGILAAIYGNSLKVPFLFDDGPSIVENPSIRSLWPPWAALIPHGNSGTTVGGRPVLNLSFAANYAMGGTDVWVYHVTNIGIHVLVTGLLFGILRRTLELPLFGTRFEGTSAFLALVAALIWSVHPLHTSAVTYIVQRAESLASLWYLLTLYCFLRAVTSGAGGTLWFFASVLSSLIGMATKEILLTVPVAVLFYDRTFLAGTFRQALLLRWRYYCALSMTWGMSIWLICRTSNRGGTAGLGLMEVWWPYALTQCDAVARYLLLIFWPNPLVFDYGELLIRNPGEVIIQAVFLLALCIGTVLLLWRKSPLGFALFWFLLLLAPTSTVVPVLVQTVAEHRVYLASAGLVVVFVLAVHSLCGRLSVVIFAVVVIAFSLLTVKRNTDYRSDVAIWRDTVTKMPQNPRASNNLGSALMRLGQTGEAEVCFREALRLEPVSAKANHNLALLLAKSGRRVEAFGYFQTALQLDSGYADAWCNLGNTLLMEGDIDEAQRCFERSRQADPEKAEAYHNLGVIFSHRGDRSAAIREFQSALRVKPDYEEARQKLKILTAAGARESL